ncbi:hypothetical protein PsAD2_01568 [Pseudovibrio axinellae]|uniref:N-acetyltransferase domain-containing protein n=1 Tax=Pseudovibrio axinellae TaxID=989403 RepID=A0A165ZN55_9HYPH|nr:GNAT family N-acetyltransferase [Pseudovibrio axinellae]KZL20082.1 hypothetical protein PsAD2_01568 [Pseudovibrio axinellae]SEQ26150.1 Protein N-acetyltransferase, RimJ/RimL family [Pseudovibrio axinellae]
MEEVLLDKCPRVETERLVLRRWEERDLEGLTEMCGHLEVMAFFGGAEAPAEVERMLDRILARQYKYGYCFPVVEDKQTAQFLGFCGLNYQETDIPSGPGVEIGWRLKREVWGEGIATEAAVSWLGFGFKTLKLREVFAIAVEGNRRSENTMKRLGMTYCEGDDFIDSGLDAGDPLAKNFLYKITYEQFWGTGL